MPPTDFAWHPWLTGPGLAFGRLFVATMDRLDDGRVRVVLHPNTPSMLRHEFLGSEDEGRRYVEAWVRQWEPELRALYGEEV